jgi:hypothetical protein
VTETYGYHYSPSRDYHSTEDARVTDRLSTALDRRHRHHRHTKSSGSRSSRKHSTRSKSFEELHASDLLVPEVSQTRPMIKSCPVTPDREFSELSISGPRGEGPPPEPYSDMSDESDGEDSQMHSQPPESPASEPISPPALSPSGDAPSSMPPPSSGLEFGLPPRSYTSLSVSSSNWSGATFSNNISFGMALEKDDYDYLSDSLSRRNSLNSVTTQSDLAIQRIGTPPSNRSNQVQRGSQWRRVKSQLSRLPKVQIPPMAETIAEVSPGAEDENTSQQPGTTLKAETFTRENFNFTTAKQQTFPLRPASGSKNSEMSEVLTGRTFPFGPKVKLEQTHDIDMVEAPTTAENSVTENRLLSPDAALPWRASSDDASDRSLSNAGTSDYTASECSDCAPTESLRELSIHDDSILIAFYIDMLQKVIIDELSNLISNEKQPEDSPEGDSNVGNTRKHHSGSNKGQASNSQNWSFGSSGQKRDRNDNTDDEGNGQGNNRNKVFKLGEKGFRLAIDHKLACPYYKRYPEKFEAGSTCAVSGWDTVHRVK